MSTIQDIAKKHSGFTSSILGGNNHDAPHQQPPASFPKEWTKPILHAVVEIGGTTVRGINIPIAEPMRCVYLMLRLDTPEQAEQICNLLSSDGEIFMKMEKTFFANRFGMLRDKFGTPWMLLNES